MKRICRQCKVQGCCVPCAEQDWLPETPETVSGCNYLRVRLNADVNGWDVDECEASSHVALFKAYAAALREDAARHQADADRLNALARYADALALVEEP